MDTTQWREKIHAQNPRFVWLATKNYQLVEEIVGFYRDLIFKKDPSSEEIHMNGSEVDPASFHAELSTIPMFDNLRLLLVRHGDLLVKKIATSEVVLGYIKRDLNNFPESTRLILHTDQESLPAAFKFIEKKALVLKEKRIFERDLMNALHARITFMKYQADKEVLHRILEKTHFDSVQAFAALERVFLYTLENKSIHIEDVENVCHDLEGDLTFKLWDLLATRKISLALNLLERHKMTDGSLLLIGWSRLFIDAWRYQLYVSSGLGEEKIVRRLGLERASSYRIKKEIERHRKVLQNYTNQELAFIFKALSKLDIDLKELNLNHRMLCSMFLTKLALSHELLS